MWAEILKYTLPSLVVFATAYLMMRTYLEKEQQQIRLQIHLENAKKIVPIRLQAYERLVLLMERITPENLIPRVFQKDMTPQQFHYALVSTVRKEYEHNLSQQIYVSSQAWEAVKAAKENVLKLINTVASDPNASKDVNTMSKVILETYAAVEQTPTEIAIEILKQEVQQLFG